MIMFQTTPHNLLTNNLSFSKRQYVNRNDATTESLNNKIKVIINLFYTVKKKPIVYETCLHPQKLCSNLLKMLPQKLV